MRSGVVVQGARPVFEQADSATMMIVQTLLLQLYFWLQLPRLWYVFFLYFFVALSNLQKQFLFLSLCLICKNNFQVSNDVVEECKFHQPFCYEPPARIKVEPPARIKVEPPARAQWRRKVCTTPPAPTWPPKCAPKCEPSAARAPRGPDVCTTPPARAGAPEGAWPARRSSGACGC